MSMSTPVCIANAVADALGTGEVLTLPLLPDAPRFACCGRPCTPPRGN